jgi:hypothetical protein
MGPTLRSSSSVALEIEARKSAPAPVTIAASPEKVVPPRKRGGARILLLALALTLVAGGVVVMRFVWGGWLPPVMGASPSKPQTSGQQPSAHPAGSARH